jgi:hypothetical protein
MPAEPTPIQSECVMVRLDPATKSAAELAAAREGLPVSTWIRNQVVAACYLEGVREAPQAVYQGIRRALRRELDGLREVRAALDGVIASLPDLVALAASTQEPSAIREAAGRMLAARLREAFAGESEEDAQWPFDRS